MIEEKMKYDVSIIGLGFVGLTLATFLAQKGIKVLGIEKNLEIVRLLQSGKPHFKEYGLTEAFKACYTKSLDVIHVDEFEKRKAPIVFISVGTPLKQGEPNLEYIDSSLSVAFKIVEKGGTIAFRSTLPIGLTRRLWEDNCDNKQDIDFAFCPERTVEGKALSELQHLPQIVSSIRGRNKELVVFFNTMGVPVIEVQKTEEAEAIKLFSNVYRDLHFSIGNLFSEVCLEHGLDENNVITSANLDYDRNDIPKPGFVGGPCLTKDAVLLSSTICDPMLRDAISAGRATNTRRIQKLLSKYKDDIHKSEKLLLSGIAFKGRPATDDVRDSPALEVLSLLKKYLPSTATVHLHDFEVTREELNKLSEDYGCSIHKDGNTYDTILILNNHEKYSDGKTLFQTEFGAQTGSLIIDLWEVQKWIV